MIIGYQVFTYFCTFSAARNCRLRFLLAADIAAEQPELATRTLLQGVILIFQH